jgi:predicted ArsR family transcriptional regulator
VYDVPYDIHELSRVLCDPTRFEVLRLIARSDTPVTVRDLVSHFDLHHSAIRVHLGRLEKAGLIGSMSLHREHVVGRPELAFFAEQRNLCMSLPPRNFELLAHLGLEALLNGQPADLDRLSEIGAQWGRHTIMETEFRPGGNGQEHLAAAMERLGEQLHVLGGTTEVASLNGDGYVLRGTNCIFAPLSEVYEPGVCALHQGAIAGMASGLAGIEFRLDHKSSMAAGDEICTTILTPLLTP